MKENFTHKVMNCKDFDEKKWHAHGCVGYKYDGVRAFYYPGESLLWSRDEKPLRGFDHIIDDLKHCGWPVDMELYIHGMEFNKLSGVIRNHDPSPEVLAGIIDVVCPGDLAQRFDQRPKDTEFVHKILHWKSPTLSHFWAVYKTVINHGYEGVVWKSIAAPYENKRNFNWMREVPIRSEDCKCTGVYEGKGKMAGIAGGIYIDFKGLQCKVGTMKGMTYEDREELLENADQYIGATCEVQYKNLQPTGKPRQPRFKGWRWDK